MSGEGTAGGEGGDWSQYYYGADGQYDPQQYEAWQQWEWQRQQEAAWAAHEGGAAEGAAAGGAGGAAAPAPVAPAYDPAAYNPSAYTTPAAPPQRTSGGKVIGPSDADIVEAFGLFDINGDGSILAEDLGDIMRALMADVSDENLGQIKARFTPADGKVTLGQFRHLMAEQTYIEINEQEIEYAFRIFDHDGSQAISAPEIRYVLKNLGIPLDPKAVEEMIKAADIDGDGKIDLVEFKKMIMM